MNKETLKKANDLAKRIKEHENALNCFEYDANYYVRDCDPALPEDMVSTNPLLIIEFDNPGEDTRDTQKIPGILSDFLIDIIKTLIKEKLILLKSEFEQL